MIGRRSLPAFIALLALLPAMSQPLAAQTNDVEALVLEAKEMEPLSGFPGGAMPDVLGLRPGMTHEEARAAIDAAGLPLLENAEEIVSDDPIAPKRKGFVYKEATVAPEFTWDDGFRLPVQPVRASAGLTMYVEMDDHLGQRAAYASDEYLWVGYGGPSAGGRVQEIYRRQKFDEPVDLETLLTSLDGKYGKPSYVRDSRSMGVDLFWYYKDGRQVMREDRNGILLKQYCKPFIPGASAEILYDDRNVGRWLGGSTDPKTSREMCEAAVFVRLRYGSVPKTVVALDVFVVDHLARWQNAAAIGAQAEAAHGEWLKSMAGSKEAPKL